MKIKNSSAKTMDQYLNIFEDVNGDWEQFEVRVKKSESTEEKAKKDKGWMTELELMEKYKSETVVKSIIFNLKKDASLWRPHPEAPECEEAIQYWALDKEQKSEVKTKMEEIAGSLALALGAKEAAAIMPLIAGFNSGASSSSFGPPPPLALPPPQGQPPGTPAPAPQGQPPQPGQPETLEQKGLRLAREQEEKAARLAADRARKADEAKKERERKKDDPVCQAKKLSDAMQKDVATLQVMKMEVDSSTGEDSQKKKYKTKVEKLIGEFDKMRSDLQKATTANAEKRMQDAELLKERMRDLKKEVALMIKLSKASE